MSEAVQTTRLFLEGREADLSDNASIAITYAVKDISDITSAASTYTKTITLPGTSNNNELFNWYFNVGVTGLLESNLNPNNPNIGNNYNPKKRIKATIIKDCQVMFEGYAQLVDATITNGLISYDIQISSPLTAFAAILSGNITTDSSDPTSQTPYRLEDLPDTLTSGYTHVLNSSNVQVSWTTGRDEPATSYLYPLIDYGQTETCNTTNFYLSSLRPCLFAKQYWDMIFANAGFTYTSDFLNSNYFKHLICPYKEGNSLIDSNGVSATSSTASSGLTTFSVIGGTTPILAFNDTISDPETLYNASTQKFAPTASGLYTFSVSFDYYFIYTPSNTSLFVTNQDCSINVDFVVYTSGGTFVSNTIVPLDVPFNSYGTWEGVWNTLNPKPNAPHGVVPPTPASVTNVPIFVEAGQVVQIQISCASSVDNAHMFFTNISGNEYVSGTTQLGIVNQVGYAAPSLGISYSDILDGSTMTYAQFCLKDVSQLDYITSIVRLFNLYVEQDESNPYQLNFWTRDEYFADQEVLDWSAKIDYSQEISVKPLPNLNNNTFLYTYRPDSDWWNKQYSSLYGGIYGEQLVSVNYDFATEQLDVLSDCIFSPTPVVQFQNTLFNSESTIEVSGTTQNIISVSGYSKYVQTAGQPAPNTSGFIRARQNNQISYWGNIYTITNVFNQYSFQVDRNVTRTPGSVGGGFYATNDVFTYVTNNSKIIPCIYQSSDNNVTRAPVAVNPRILYYSGAVNCPSGETWTLQATPIPNNSSSFNYTYVGGSPSATALSSYPFCSHLNSPTQPTIDLLFAPPKAVFYNGIYPTGIPNQFTYYWENALNEIIDNDAKLVTCYMNLNSLDIANLDLSNAIYINGTNYKINQIIDYAADRSISTQAELIRLPRQRVNPLSAIFPPVANAGSNQSLQLCLGTTNISASGSTEDPTAYLWSILSGPSGGAITSPGSENTSFTFTNAGTYVLQVQVQPGGSKATATITVNAPVANAGSDQSTQLCNGSVNLSASGSTGCITGYTWSLVSGPSGSSFGSSTSQNTTFNFTNAGTYVAEVTLQPGSVTDTVNITAVAPVANAGADQILLFPTSSTSVSASGSTGCITSYAWSQISGPNSATISSPSSMNTNVSGLITGTYVLQAEVQPGNVTDTMSIIIDSPVTLTVSGGTSLTDTITGVTVGGVSSVHTSGTNFPITGGQTGVFNAGANPFGSVSVVVSLSNAVVGEVVNIIDTAGSHQSTTITTAGAQTVPFTCSMLPGQPASINVQPEPPTVNISNNRPGATISSVTGIAGFTSGSLGSGASVSGYHTAFTGTISVNFSVGPTSASNLYLTGAFTQTIAVAAGFTGTKTFTSETYGTTSVIDITLAT